MLTEKKLEALNLPSHIEWTEGNGSAYVVDTREDAKTFRDAIETLLGPDHPAVLRVRCAFYGDGDSGWTVSLDYIGRERHCTVFPAQEITMADQELLEAYEADTDCPSKRDTPTMTPERADYFKGLPDFVRNAIAAAIEGDVSGDIDDARGWLEGHKLTIQCSADILSDRNWEELNHLDAFLNELRKAESGEA